jgi:hypothetical protein
MGDGRKRRGEKDKEEAAVKRGEEMEWEKDEAKKKPKKERVKER